MKTLSEATHRHKRAGAVIVLQTTSELAKIAVPVTGEEYWVKISDLSELGAEVPAKTKTSKKASKADKANTAADDRYHAARVA